MLSLFLQSIFTKGNTNLYHVIHNTTLSYHTTIKFNLFKGNQGFLSMLKQKFSRSSNRNASYDSSSLSRPGKSRQRNARFYEEDIKNGADGLAPTTSGNLNATNATNSANVTPELMRRSYAPEMRNESGIRY